MMVTIATGKGERLGTVKNVTIEWDELARKLTAHKVGKKGESFFVGGHFKGNTRKEDELVARSLLTLDIDNSGLSLQDLEFDLMMAFDGAFIAYSTHSHTPDHPRVRVVAPLSRELTPGEYRAFSRQFVDRVGLNVDQCSFKPNQVMYTASCADSSLTWTLVQAGEPVAVPDAVLDDAVVSDSVDSVADDGIESALRDEPLDITDERVDATLLAYTATGLSYDEWVSVGAALHHQYQGSNEGYTRWVEWSRLDASRFDPTVMPIKWRSFGDSSRVSTFASVIYRCNESGGVACASGGSVFDSLLREAGEVKSLDQYLAFKSRITTMDNRILPPVHRAMLVSALAEGFGRANKVGKVAIGKELQPIRSESGFATANAPAWLKPWVYVENTCEFANVEVADYRIRREAFNAKYDRETECLESEKQASQFALVDCAIPTVVDTMFFPGADRMFEFESKQMLNSYSAKGVAPCAELDADGQQVVDMFLRHIALTLENEAEQKLLIDWMAYVYQNPGRRVGWAMLLQGAQGVGKSYFGNVLEMIMGSNVKSLEPTAIAGRFTGWAHGSIVTVIEEVRISGTNKYEILDRLKPILSNSTIQIEEKGRDHRTVPNFTSYLLLTNHKDAVPIQDGDRRYCALFSRAQSEDELFEQHGGRDESRRYFNRLFDETGRRADAIARFLADWRVNDSFNPNGRAPTTSAIAEMKALSVSPERDLIDGFIEFHRCEIINDDILDVTWLNKLVKSAADELPNSRKLATILSEMGYSPMKGRRININGNGHHYIWVGRKYATHHPDCVVGIVRKFHSADDDDSF